MHAFATYKGQLVSYEAQKLAEFPPLSLDFHYCPCKCCASHLTTLNQ